MLVLGTVNTLDVQVYNPLETSIELSVACSRIELSNSSICPKLQPGETGILKLILTDITGSTVRQHAEVVLSRLSTFLLLAATPFAGAFDCHYQQDP